MSTGTRLEHLPISYFATVMGLSGLTIAWEKAESVLALPVHPAGTLMALTSLVFVLLVAFYAGKVVRYPQAVAAELRHPVKLSFFPTISISLILLSVCTLHAAPALSLGLWTVGPRHICCSPCTSSRSG